MQAAGAVATERWCRGGAKFPVTKGFRNAPDPGVLMLVVHLDCGGVRRVRLCFARKSPRQCREVIQL